MKTAHRVVVQDSQPDSTLSLVKDTTQKEVHEFYLVSNYKTSNWSLRPTEEERDQSLATSSASCRNLFHKKEDSNSTVEI